MSTILAKPVARIRAMMRRRKSSPAASGPQAQAAKGAATPIHPWVITGTLVLSLVMTVVIGGVSFDTSFTVLQDLAGSFGWPAGKEWQFPIIVDGTIATSMLIVIALSQHTDRATVLGRNSIRVLQYVAVAVSVGGNAFHAYETQDEQWRSVIAAIIASIAPIFLLAMTEAVKILISAPRRSAPDVVDTPDADDAVPTQEAQDAEYDLFEATGVDAETVAAALADRRHQHWEAVAATMRERDLTARPVIEVAEVLRSNYDLGLSYRQNGKANNLHHNTIGLIIKAADQLLDNQAELADAAPTQTSDEVAAESQPVGVPALAV